MINVYIAIVMLFAPSEIDEYIYKLGQAYGFELNWSYKELGYYNGEPMLGGTVYDGKRCINEAYIDPDVPEHLLRGVLAHEQAHVYQGKDCVDNEREAHLISLDMMWEIGEYDAWANWMTFLQEEKEFKDG